MSAKWLRRIARSNPYALDGFDALERGQGGRDIIVFD